MVTPSKAAQTLLRTKNDDTKLGGHGIWMEFRNIRDWVAMIIIQCMEEIFKYFERNNHMYENIMNPIVM